jgi:hypothetical protein
MYVRRGRGGGGGGAETSNVETLIYVYQIVKNGLFARSH